MNTQLTTRIEKLHTNLQVARAWAEKWADKLPDNFGNISIEMEPMFGAWIFSDREKMLLLIGDVFGRDGWIAEPHGRDSFQWSKIVDGVKVLICNAEEMPPVVPHPVHPSKFPLQLSDSQ